nr:reverse transcriptase domain-containing protein [Tanacetum cinerariifolium]
MPSSINFQLTVVSHANNINLKPAAQKFDESFHEAWERYKDILRTCPHYGFTELHQLDTFYNALNPTDQDSLNAAAGGNLLEKSPQDALMIIENKSEETSALTTAMMAMLKKFQSNPPSAQVKAVDEICVTCGGAHPYYQCFAAGGNTFLEYRDNIQGYVSAATCNYNQGNSGYRPQGVANQMRLPGSGTLSGNTIANPKGEIKAITTRSGLVTKGPIVSNPPKSVNPEEDECVEETYTDPDHAEYTIKVPPPPPFADELALISYPPDYDDNHTCDIESDIREIEFLLYQEMFTDEQSPNYSFPSRFDVYPDDFLEYESDAHFDDYSFDSEGEKIKEAKLLIDQLDLPCDILFEYDSFNSQDFSRDDVLPYPDNEDKVFNPGILSHEKLILIITRFAQEKRLAVSYASLLFEDFDPPFYELLVFKEVPNSIRLLLFSSKNEEKVFKPGIYIFKKFHC